VLCLCRLAHPRNQNELTEAKWVRTPRRRAGAIERPVLVSYSVLVLHAGLCGGIRENVPQLRETEEDCAEASARQVAIGEHFDEHKVTVILQVSATTRTSHCASLRRCGL